MGRTTGAVLAMCVLGLACGDDDAVADAGTDTGRAEADAGADANEPEDGGADEDAGTDAGMDAGPCGACTASQFCETAPGSCDEGERRCSPVPDVCAPADAPVCGCDGVTYESDCRRRQARVGRAFEGACEGLTCDPPCAGAEYCRHPSGNGCSGAGECALPAPSFECEASPEAPVCGCDGVTYRNRICAEGVPVAVAGDGPC